MINELKSLIKEAHKDLQAIHLKINGEVFQFRGDEQGNRYIIPIDISLISASENPEFKKKLIDLVSDFKDKNKLTDTEVNEHYQKAINVLKVDIAKSLQVHTEIADLNDIEFVDVTQVYDVDIDSRLDDNQLYLMNQKLRLLLRLARASIYNKEIYHELMSSSLETMDIWSVIVSRFGLKHDYPAYVAPTYLMWAVDKILNDDEMFESLFENMPELISSAYERMSDEEFSRYLIARLKVLKLEEMDDSTYDWYLDTIVDALIEKDSDYRNHLSFSKKCKWVTPTKELTKHGEICVNFKGVPNHLDEVSKVKDEDIVDLDSYLDIPTGSDEVVFRPEHAISPGLYWEATPKLSNLVDFVSTYLGSNIGVKTGMIDISHYDTTNSGSKYKLGQSTDGSFYLFPDNYKATHLFYHLGQENFVNTGVRMGNMLEVPILRDMDLHVPLGKTLIIYCKNGDDWKGYRLTGNIKVK